MTSPSPRKAFPMISHGDPVSSESRENPFKFIRVKTGALVRLKGNGAYSDGALKLSITVSSAAPKEDFEAGVKTCQDLLQHICE